MVASMEISNVKTENETDDSSTNDPDDSMASASGLLSNSAIKAKIAAGEFTINHKRGRSRVWDVFGTIKNELGKEIPNLVVCKTCFSVYIFHTKSTSNLVKHKCYVVKKIRRDKNAEKTDADSDDKRQSALLVTKWTIENCRSVNILSDGGLRNFAQFLLSVGAKHGQNVDIDTLLPHPDSVSRNIQNLYEKHLSMIKAEVMSIKDIGYGLTSDIWTDSYLRTTYLSLTIHYVVEGKLVTRLLGLKSMKDGSCTGIYMRTKIVAILNKFECNLKDNSIVVTKRDQNMIAAFHSFNHIFCTNHVLNHAIEQTIEHIPELMEICNTCTELVKCIKDSNSNDPLQVALETRFNQKYYLLLCIEKNWAQITDTFGKGKKLQKIDLTTISALVKVLSYFEETSTKLEGETYPTLHLAIVHIHRLKKMCTHITDEPGIVKMFKRQLNSHLDSIVSEYLTISHKIALFLFPPANKLIQFSEAEKTIIKDECKTIMKIYTKDVSKQETRVSEPMLNDDLDSLSSDSKDLFADFIQPSEVANSNDEINNEILTYQNVNVMFHEDFNVLQWWHLHQKEFPLLYKVSCKILATPASSAASERIIASARMLLAEKRSMIGSDPVLAKQIMFLHSNSNQIKISNDLEELL